MPEVLPYWTGLIREARQRICIPLAIGEMKFICVHTGLVVAEINENCTRFWSSWTSDDKWVQDSGLLTEKPRKAAAGLLKEKLFNYSKYTKIKNKETMICGYKLSSTRRCYLKVYTSSGMNASKIKNNRRLANQY